MTWDSNLDPQSPAYQIAADNFRYIRVLAGPGTGKSFALKRRVARLLEGGIAPARILSVTFTKVAAEDLHRELINMGVPRCCSTVSRRRARISGLAFRRVAIRPSTTSFSRRETRRQRHRRWKANEIGFWDQMCPLGHFNAKSGGGHPPRRHRALDIQSDLRSNSAQQQTRSFSAGRSSLKP
jgi:hypothetical protein